MKYSKKQIKKGFEVYNRKFTTELPECFSELEGNESDAQAQTEFLIMCIEKPEEEIDEYLKSKLEKKYSIQEISEAIKKAYIKEYSLLTPAYFIEAIAQCQTEKILHELKLN